MNKIKKAACLSALFTLTVFLNGSAIKESPSRSLSQIPDHYQSFMHHNKTVTSDIAIGHVGWNNYKLVLVYDANLKWEKAKKFHENLKGVFNDAVFHDVNILSELGGLEMVSKLDWKTNSDGPRNIYADSLPGGGVQTQKIFNAASMTQGVPVGNAEWLTYLYGKSREYGHLGLHRYGFSIARDRLLVATGIDPQCPENKFGRRPANHYYTPGNAGQWQRVCDYLALVEVHLSMQIWVYGKRIAPDLRDSFNQ